MSFPEGPLWILGRPFTFKFTDLPDPNDSNYNWRAYPEKGLFRILDCLCEERRRETIFTCILGQVYPLMGRGKHDTNADLYEVFAQVGRAMYGTLRSNPGVLAYVAGWTAERPDTFNVCGFEWTVRWVDHIRGADKTTHGETTWGEQLVEMRNDMAREHTGAILLHELTHAVCFYVAHQYRSDEQFVRAVENVLASVFHDNPDFMRSLFS